MQVFFVESVCEDPDVIAQNIVVSVSCSTVRPKKNNNKKNRNSLLTSSAGFSPS